MIAEFLVLSAAEEVLYLSLYWALKKQNTLLLYITLHVFTDFRNLSPAEEAENV